MTFDPLFKVAALLDRPEQGGFAKLRVGLICDYREEAWPSMDLTGDMLFQHLTSGHGDGAAVEQLRPGWNARLSSFPRFGDSRLARNGDRLLNRFLDYPRWLKGQVERFDLFHVMDHSYSQLAHTLPPGRTIVTCHDLDTFRCLLEPQREPRPRWFKAIARHTLEGFLKAAHVTCVSNATRDEIVRLGLFPEDRLSVVRLGVHPSLSSTPEAVYDQQARQLASSGSGDLLYLLHVGSTVPRKRIDVLLEVFASVLGEFPHARLVKAGGRFTDEQSAIASRLGLDGKIVFASGIEPRLLAALYRGAAALLQTSDREGFGLPVIEALACGCPVLASDIAPLREAGGAAAEYCPVEQVPTWSRSLARLLRERSSPAEPLNRRRDAGLRHAAGLTWEHTASQTMAIYRRVSNPTACTSV